MRPGATFPERMGTSPNIYSVSLLNVDEKEEEDAVQWMSTGLVINPDPGYTVSITASSALLKAGYMIPMAIHLSSGSTQEILIPVYALRKSPDPIPSQACRLVVSTAPTVYMKLVGDAQFQAHHATRHRKKPVIAPIADVEFF